MPALQQHRRRTEHHILALIAARIENPQPPPPVIKSIPLQTINPLLHPLPSAHAQAHLHLQAPNKKTPPRPPTPHHIALSKLASNVQLDRGQPILRSSYYQDYLYFLVVY